MDKCKTKVKFLVHGEGEDAEIFAYFPTQNYSDGERNLKVCYASIGQHSACHEDYAAESRPATPAEYEDLKNELSGLGYNLKIM